MPLPASGVRPPGHFWRDFAIGMAALACGLFAAPPIRDSLGLAPEPLPTIAISLPVMFLVHMALRRLFRVG